MKVVLAALNAKYIHSSLALRYIQSYCCDTTADIVVKDFTINHQLLAILSDIYYERPAVVGLACYIWNMGMVLDLAGLIKKVMPNTQVVLGGPEVSYDAAALLVQHSQIDYIVQGEGEQVCKELFAALALPVHEQEAALTAIDGLARKLADGTIRAQGTATVVASLDTVPFPYDDTDMAALADKIIYYESSRGCPFSCQYCLSSATSGVRFRSLELVYQELAYFIRHKVRQVKFVDRTFNAKREHYLPIMQFLAAQTCDTNFHFEIAVDLLPDDVIAFLQTVPPGRFQFEIGVQSTNPPTLAAIQRHNQWDKIVRNVTQLRQADNIHLHLDLIAGLPLESYQQFGQSFNDVYQLQPHMLQLGFLKMLKGSGMRAAAAQYGYIFADYAPYEVLGHDRLSYEELCQLKIMDGIFDQVYNSGRFCYVLAFLLRESGLTPFALFDRLTLYWQKRQLDKLAHTTKTMYTQLLAFAVTELGLAAEVCCEVMKFNALLLEKGTLRPEGLGWNEKSVQDKIDIFWRTEELASRYLSQYRFTNWRDIKKKHHIEVFSFAIATYFATKQPLSQQSAAAAPEAVLFSFAQQPGYRVIAEADTAIWGGCHVI